MLSNALLSLARIMTAALSGGNPGSDLGTTDTIFGSLSVKKYVIFFLCGPLVYILQAH